MIDSQASTTVTPFIESIFDQQEVAAKQAIARLRTPQASASPAPPAPNTPSTTNLAASSNGEPPATQPAAPSGVRKRLFSYVVREGDGKTKTKPGTSSGSKTRSDVELAGEKLLINFCIQHGLRYTDVTAENKGYDFEIQTNDATFVLDTMPMFSDVVRFLQSEA